MAGGEGGGGGSSTAAQLTPKGPVGLDLRDGDDAPGPYAMLRWSSPPAVYLPRGRCPT